MKWEQFTGEFWLYLDPPGYRGVNKVYLTKEDADMAEKHGQKLIHVKGAWVHGVTPPADPAAPQP